MVFFNPCFGVIYRLWWKDNAFEIDMTVEGINIAYEILDLFSGISVLNEFIIYCKIPQNSRNKIYIQIYKVSF